MGNTINAALREPQAVALVDAVLPYNNLHVHDVEAYWRSFYDHAESFALTRAQLRVICTKAASFLDPHRSSKRAIQQADAVFDVFVPNGNASDAPAVIDALEFLSTMVFIASIPIEDKVDLVFDSWDMSEDGALDLDELTISLKSTLLGLAKVLKIEGGDSKTTAAGLSTLDDDELEILAERVFREIAKLPATSASLNQVTINCDQFRAYCMENKSARALFDVLDRADVVVRENQLDDDQDIDGEYDELDPHATINPSQPDTLGHGSITTDAVGKTIISNMIDQGDEFLTVKPWKGAIVPPSKIPSIDKAAPAVSVALEWIFGYNAHDSKNNVRYCVNQPDDIVYPAAGVCVVLNTKTRCQRHYLGHTDDVLCISTHPKHAIVASGEIGKKPKVNVWNSTSMETLCVLQGFHQRAVMLLAFCGESMLISVGGDDDHSVAVYETSNGWKSATLKSISKGNKATPHHLCASTSGSTVEFVCCGDKFIDFWTYDGKSLAHKKGVLGTKGSLQAFLVAEFMGGPNSVVVGTNDGSLYLFTGRDLTMVLKGTLGALQSMHFQTGLLTVGTKSGHLTLYDDKLKQIGGPFCVKDFAISGTSSGVRSCCASFDKKSALIGTAASEIYEIDLKTGNNIHGGALASGHFSGELWGLDVHPQKTQCCTVGDDRTLRVWDLEKKRELRSVTIDMPGRTCAYSADGRMIAVGLGADGSNTSGRGSKNTARAKLPSGGFIVFSECDLSVVKDPCYEPKKWVSDIKFSPDDRVLAVASHDTTVYLYDALKGFSKKQAFKKHTSYVTHVDFSTDGQHLQSTCGGYELLFSDAKTGRHITNASSLRDERWHTMTCTLGWSVQGIWEECSDGTDVNAVDRSRNGTLLATGDDFGKVKVFRYPCAVEKASYVELRGHSSHVTKVKWSYHDKWVISTGGNDRCVFVWRNENASGGGSRDLAEATKERAINDHQPAVDSNALREVDSTGEFDDIENDVGDEFMAVKPWLGAVVAPTDANNMKLNSSSPDARLELERVNGYQAQNASNNARYDSQGKVIYHAAALGIVYDKATQKQSFFKFHDDDIVALCMHPNGSTVATAQMGKKPKIYTWSSANPAKATSLLEGFHERVVCAICFSSDGKKLGSIGGDDDHSVAIYSWENGLLAASAKGERNSVLAICYHDGQWVSCGEKHVRFWREQGKNLTSKKAIFGKAKHKDNKMPGVFEAVVSFGTWAVVGASNGDLYLFQGSNELARVVTAHSASAYALHATAHGELVTGGKDGTVMVWDASVANIFKLDMKEHASPIGLVDVSIRSICLAPRSSRTFLIGTHGSDLIEVDTSRSSSIAGSTSWIARGHSQLEVWGLAAHPARPEYCSAGDDQLLRVWCLQKKELLRQHKLEAMARTCTIFASGKTEVVAIGLGGRYAGTSSRNTKVQTKTGSILIVEYSDLYKRLFEDKPSKQPISEVKFSPSGTVLAVGSHDNNIYLYKVQDTTFRKIVKAAIFSKHHSYITHFDFSADGRFLQSSCGAYELLFSDTASGKQITSASSTKDVKWHTWTCVLGWPVQGIWPPCSDGTDVNAADRNRRGDLLATSDDFGLVKLYRYPCVAKNASAVEHRGHSSHVTNVRWSAGDSHVISAGGNDRCIMEWKLVRENEGSDGAVKPVDTQTEGSEDDESFDNDAEGDEFMAVKPWIGAIVPPSNAPAPNARIPDLHIELDWVYGYHTELSKRNLVYNSHGEIVYHIAAVGVIYDQMNHLQKHHVCHNDDIMSFAVTAKRDIVATGERGKKPVIRVWDAHTGELRCELKGFHSRGIVSLAFSPDAKKLVSVGDDDDHSVALWEDKSHGSWTSGGLMASARGDKGVHRFSCFGRDESTVVTGGVKHVLFWRVEGKTMVAKKGKVGKRGTMQTFPSGCVFGGDVVTGTASGELYVWTGDDLSKVVKAHDGESTVVTAHEVPSNERQSTSTQVLLSGGRDGKVAMWNSAFQALKTVDVGSLSPGCLNKSIASAFLSTTGQILLVGTCSSDILEFDMSTGAALHGGRPLLSGHFALELWGLATHPSVRQFSTVGDDGTLRTWDMDARKLVSMSTLATKARACAYSPDGAMLAIGYGGDNGVRRKAKAGSISKEGAFVVLNAQGDSRVLFEDRPATEWISDIKFSPCGNLLAVGSHDNAIYLYSVNEAFKKRKPFQKHNSYITHFDFSKDSRYLQSNCGAYELLFCATASSEQIRSASSLKDTAWHTWTCTLGWPVQGIWPECADGTDVNSVCASASRTLLATGDDSSRVKIFRYPCTMKGSKFLEARGHASHVTSVRFSHDDKFLISTGGNDRSIFQWKLS